MIGKFVNGLFGKIVDNAEGILDKVVTTDKERDEAKLCLLYTSPSPRDGLLSRMPSSA